MKKQSFLIGALILAVGGLVAKIVGALYKIPLTNILGTNGMGLYYLVFPFYSLLLVLISSGVSLAVTRLVCLQRINHNKKNELIILKTAIIYVFVLSIIFGVILVLLAERLAILQGNINAKVGYFAIAPSIAFASTISVLRGYFQGLENMVPTLINNILEQVIKLISGLILANIFLKQGVTFAVFGAILGVTISEFVALILIIINYLVYKKKFIYKTELPKNQKITYTQALKLIVSYAYPATLTAIIMPITSFLDSFLIVNILTGAGFSSLQATNLYGISNGIVNTLINLPVLICSSIATAIVPSLSGLYAKNNGEEVGFKTSLFIKVTWLIAIPCFLLFLIYSPDIITILYSNGLSDLVIDEFTFSYKLLMLSSVSIIYYAFLQTFTSILQSFNKPAVPFFSLLVALVVRIICIFTLVSNYKINIFGVTIANLIFLSVACVINLFYIKKFVNVKFNLLKMLVIPVFSAVVSGVVMCVVKLSLLNTNVWVYTSVSALIGIVTYFVFIFMFKSFNKKELRCFKRKRILN